MFARFLFFAFNNKPRVNYTCFLVFVFNLGLAVQYEVYINTTGEILLALLEISDICL